MSRPIARGAVIAMVAILFPLAIARCGGATAAPDEQAIRAARSAQNAAIASVEVSAKWPLAYERGTWAGHLGGTKGPVIISGRYGAQCVKRGGRWLIRGELYVALDCSGIGCGYAAAP